MKSSPYWRAITRNHRYQRTGEKMNEATLIAWPIIKLEASLVAALHMLENMRASMIIWKAKIKGRCIIDIVLFLAISFLSCEIIGHENLMFIMAHDEKYRAKALIILPADIHWYEIMTNCRHASGR